MLYRFCKNLLANNGEGLPPVLNFGTSSLQNRIVPEILSGKKFICLAVTEAFAGSDVASLRCRAIKVDDGWIVNGTSV